MLLSHRPACHPWQLGYPHHRCTTWRLPSTAPAFPRRRSEAGTGAYQYSPAASVLPRRQDPWGQYGSLILSLRMRLTLWLWFRLDFFFLDVVCAEEHQLFEHIVIADAFVVFPQEGDS